MIEGISDNIYKVLIKVRNESEWISCCDMLYSHGYRWQDNCMDSKKIHGYKLISEGDIYLVIYNHTDPHHHDDRLFYNTNVNVDIYGPDVIIINYVEGMDLHEIIEVNKLGLI